ncbi:sensor domain-containing protein [Baaleninema sp.]|uniref:sensor domain-containing protein n=1 Tax=Baaleninema sp. TaxID=3101197 RepID=UPI003CFE5575
MTHHRPPSSLKNILSVCSHLVRQVGEGVRRFSRQRDRDDLNASLFDAIPVAIALRDGDGRTYFKNSSWRESFSDRDDLEEICAEDRDRVRQTLDRAVLTGKNTTLSYGILSEDGTERAIVETLTPLSTRDQRTPAVVRVRFDVSNLKQVEQTLQEREKQLSTLIQSISDGLIVVDRQGTIRFVNPAAAILFGRSISSLLGEELGIPSTGDTVTELETLSTTGKVNVSQMKTQTLEWDGVASYVILLRDITDRRQAEEAQRQSQHLAEQIADLTPTFVHIFDLQQRRNLYVNRHNCQFFGRTANQLRQEGEALALERIHPEDIDQIERLYNRLAEAEDGEILESEFRLKNKDDQWRWLHKWDVVLTRTASGLPQQILGTAIDITERKQMEEELRQTNAQLQAIFAALPDLFFRIRSDGTILDYQAGTAVELYLPPEAFLGHLLQELLPSDIAPQFQAAISRVCQTQEFVTLEYVLPIDGNTQHYECRLTPIAKDETIAIVRNISDRKRAEEQLRYDALHDALTGLPNRSLFVDRLAQAIQRAKRRSHYLFAVLFLDLDRFKVINESVGHSIGDRLLVEIARRLEGCLRAADSVARLGGDEFTVLLDDLDNPEEVTRISRRIQRALLPPFNIDGHEMFTTVSIGIALSSTGYDRPEDVLRDADIAMYRAKERGKARHEVFDRAMHERAMERLQLESELWRAVDRLGDSFAPHARSGFESEFKVVYQPIVDLQTEQLAGFEALVRWHHPTRGRVSPGEFIPVAEETGAIVPLGEWILAEACRQLQAWRTGTNGSAASRLRVSVNLSGKQLEEPEFLHRIDRVLARTQLPGEALKLEMTESMLMENSEATMDVLQQLRDRGIQLSIDDFGTGYSCLSYLQQFPVNTLKIDRSFVSPIGGDRENLGIVQAILNLATHLGMDAIAEGIETAEQFECLKDLGCRYAQGYFVSHPLEVPAATEWIDRL